MSHTNKAISGGKHSTQWLYLVLLSVRARLKSLVVRDAVAFRVPPPLSKLMLFPVFVEYLQNTDFDMYLCKRKCTHTQKHEI